MGHCSFGMNSLAIQTRHHLPYYIVGIAHKLEQVLRDGDTQPGSKTKS